MFERATVPERPAATETLSTVLVLEDDSDVREHLIGYLAAPGIRLIACAEIEAAECLLARESPQVLVTDLCVSNLGGLEGLRLIRFAATHFPDTRIVVYSGYVDRGVEQTGRALGADEVLQKPRDLPRLREVVRRAERRLLPGTRPHGRACGVRRVELLEDLLAQRRVRSVLQPVFAVDRDGPPFEPYGFEGLARGPEESPLADPELLFAYARRKRLLLETDLRCLESALDEARALDRPGLLLLNAQPDSIASPSFAPELRDMALARGFRPERIVIEVTEHASIVNPRAFARSVSDLREYGFRLALDDYGEGFANLHLLEHLRPEFLKVAGCFTREVHRRPARQAIVASTLALAERLGMRVVMEQVETAEELATLRRLGVPYVQGYLLARPARASTLAASLPDPGGADVRPWSPPSPLRFQPITSKSPASTRSRWPLRQPRRRSRTSGEGASR